MSWDLRKQKRIRSQLFDFCQNLTIESTNFSLTDSILTFGKETSFQNFYNEKRILLRNKQSLGKSMYLLTFSDNFDKHDDVRKVFKWRQTSK